ncbi:hypothetical protein SAMN04487972_1572 [Paracoccus halophilus]|uniref:Uncharacterized protein n=1 Tax=Paracoccus halophilus TaxID=376733 RepID=A0A099ETR6_9RHOB|nr:hypothetical protein [Paracoccus halophilus]KGJ01659.1 hypothetical protein IT41_19595 [Paracoccus halophilus]SFA62683.1 hypothetical protein SAMN04487972_1572 [Paracoccus halophilus]
MPAGGRISGWIYRGTVLLTGLLAVQAFRFGIRTYERSFGDLTDVAQATLAAKIALMSGLQQPMLIGLILIALIMRSGAVVWLTGWFLISNPAPLLISALGADQTEAVILTLSVVGLAVLVIFWLLTYLVRTGELRRP